MNGMRMEGIASVICFSEVKILGSIALFSTTGAKYGLSILPIIHGSKLALSNAQS